MPDFKKLARERLEQEKTGAAPSAPTDDDRYYRAFRQATRHMIALSIRLSDGSRLQYPYTYFRGGMYWDKGEYVQLDFGDLGLVHLWGSRLLEIEEQLGEGNVRLLEEFNPERWGTPPEGEAVIERIEFQRVGEKPPELDTPRLSARNTDPPPARSNWPIGGPIRGRAAGKFAPTRGALPPL